MLCWFNGGWVLVICRLQQLCVIGGKNVKLVDVIADADAKDYVDNTQLDHHITKGISCHRIFYHQPRIQPSPWLTSKILINSANIGS
jgi:hypothetical protein